MAQAYNHAGNYEMAAKWYEKARDLFTEQFGPHDQKTEQANELLELMKWKQD
jgi:hypothetical protein